MKFFSTAVFTSAILALASAQQAQPIVSVTSPLTGTKYQAGSKAIISWINPTVPKISQIVLARGDANALQPIGTIGRDINTADGKYEWDVPYDCENGNNYAFELGTSPDLAFTGHFTLEGCTGGGFASISGGNPSPAAPGNGSSAASPSGATTSSGSPVPSANGASPAAAAASPSSGSSSGSTSSSASSSSAQTSGTPASAGVRLSSNQAIAALGVVVFAVAHAF